MENSEQILDDLLIEFEILSIALNNSNDFVELKKNIEILNILSDYFKMRELNRKKNV